jgi:hypothetical protein
MMPIAFPRHPKARDRRNTGPAMLDFVLTSIAAPIAVAIATTFVLNARTVAPMVESHRRRVADLNEDLRRWVRDRDQVLDWQLREISGWVGPVVVSRISDVRARAMSGQHPAGTTLERRARARELALQEWRDEASRKIREFDQLGAEEGWLHRWVRRRRRIELHLWMPDDAVMRLERWRADEEERNETGATVDSVGVVDPTAENVEPRIRELERTGLSI